MLYALAYVPVYHVPNTIMPCIVLQCYFWVKGHFVTRGNMKKGILSRGHFVTGPLVKGPFITEPGGERHHVVWTLHMLETQCHTSHGRETHIIWLRDTFHMVQRHGVSLN